MKFISWSRLSSKLVAVALLAACVETTSMASRPIPMSEGAVSAGREYLSLFDPFSAQFRREALYQIENGNFVYCGQVNAKNRFGAYVGYTDFYVRFRLQNGQAALYRTYTDVTAKMACDEARAGLITGVVADAVAVQ